jgi:flavin reductase (DIM6/NTAB) family NADH-FMN oxidoreductase RutF
MKKKSLPLSQVYRHLEPGPVVLVSTSRKGKPNIMTMSWLTMIDFEPPIFGCIISNRDYTFDTVKATKQCVINIPTAELAKQVVGCGNTTGSKINKFKKFHLTPVAAKKIDAPLIAECYVNLECKVIDMKLADKYNLFVMEVVQAWITPGIKHPRTLHHRGKGVFMVAGKEIKLPSKMK